MFCPKCGSILLPKKSGKKKVMGCSCGYIDRQNESPMQIREEVATKERKPGVMDNKQVLDTLPTTEAECPACRHGVAYYWTLQTRAGDEAETKMLKCEKC